MTAGGATTTFRYGGAQLGGEFNLSSASNQSRQLRIYLYAGGGDTPLLWLEGVTQLSTSLTQAPTWFHADRLGSVVATTNASGAVTAYAYGPYGEPQTWAGSRFRYTGQLALPEAQLYHYRARAYDPMLGRFLQTDPIGYGDGPNLYAYVLGDPVNGTDPSGNYATVDEVVVNPICWGSTGFGSTPPCGGGRGYEPLTQRVAQMGIPGGEPEAFDRSLAEARAKCRAAKSPVQREIDDLRIEGAVHVLAGGGTAIVGLGVAALSEGLLAYVAKRAAEAGGSLAAIGSTELYIAAVAQSYVDHNGAATGANAAEDVATEVFSIAGNLSKVEAEAAKLAAAALFAGIDLLEASCKNVPK